MKPTIWTPDTRRVLYGRLVELFGPYEMWEKSSSPGRGLDDAFHNFCHAFAVVVGARSADAVKHQIRFAMPESDSGTTWEANGHVQTALLNKAAALEAGFIRAKHLPDIYAVGRKEVV